PGEPSGGGNGYEIYDPNQKLPDLQELIRQKQEMRKDWDAQRSGYDRVHSQVARHAKDLAGKLRNFLRENQRPKYSRTPVRTGRKLSIKGAMRAEEKEIRTGRSDPNTWLNRSKPSKRGYEFMFILDGSGSMIGEKWNQLVKALVLCSEALDSLHINFGVVQYADNAKVHKELKERYTHQSRDALYNTIHQPFSGGNNERVGIETALALFERQGTPGHKKVMFLITDGVCDVGPVKELTKKAREKDIILIGIGIGPEMRAVLDTYEDNVVVEHIDKLPAQLAAVVRQQIEGKDEKFA
ncbi:MAG: vWA domain-containing protein, partial [Candidatus Eremiobacterota bacterium]